MISTSVSNSSLSLPSLHSLPVSPYRHADGSPKLPEGTLGRIAASSLRKPKKLMSLTGAADAAPLAPAAVGHAPVPAPASARLCCCLAV